MAALLRSHGAAYEPRVVSQLLEFSYRHVAEVLQEAQHYANHRAVGGSVTLADSRLAAASLLTHTFTEPLGGEELARLVAPLNAQPLPPVRTTPGLTVPPEVSLLQPVVQLLQPQQAAAQPTQAAPSSEQPLLLPASAGVLPTMRQPIRMDAEHAPQNKRARINALA